MTKNLVIESLPDSSMVRIKYEGGGETPDELKGLWTTPTIARDAIKAWMAANSRELEVKVRPPETAKDK